MVLSIQMALTFDYPLMPPPDVVVDRSSELFVDYLTTIFCNFKSGTIYIYFEQELNFNIAPQLIASTMSTECASLIIVKYINGNCIINKNN